MGLVRAADATGSLEKLSLAQVTTTSDGQSIRMIRNLTVSEQLIEATYAVGDIVANFFKGAKLLLQDVNKFEQCCAKFDRIFTMIDTVKNTNYFSKLKVSLGAAGGCLNLAQLAGTVDYFINNRFKQEWWPLIAGNVSIAVVNVGWAMMWLQEMSLFTLSKAAEVVGNVKVFSFMPKLVESVPCFRASIAMQNIAKSMGELRIFSCITKISIGTFVSSALAIGYGFFAIDAFHRLFVTACNHEQTTHAALDASHYVAEVLYGVLALSCTNVIVLGVAAGVAFSLGLSAFMYKIVREKELKATALN